MKSIDISVSKKREANLDLLRIVSMLLIIFLHSIDHSGVLENAEVSGFPIYTYVRFTYALTQICVNCYVLISGYFLVTSKFRIQKLVALWMEVVFYSFVIKIIFMAVGYIPFSVTSLISCFFPVFTGRYWFITIYFGMYLISPFLNIAIKAMNKNQHTTLNILLFFLFSAWISLHPSIAGMNSGEGWGLAWFIVLYFAAAWFRLYYQPNGRIIGKLCIWFFIAACMTILLIFGKKYCSPINVIAENWYRYDSLPVYLASLVVFVAFLNIKIKNKTFFDAIVTIAPSTLGVYLIHAHAEFSPWSWEVFALPEKMNYVWFPIVQIFVVVLLFVCCVLIDLLRKNTVGRLENSKSIYKLSDYFTITITGLIRTLVDKM